ncbi:MAG: helix-turn-helix domain-containing protein [Acidimicrobiales bacterium]
MESGSDATFLTVEQAAQRLGVSRNTAYLATKQYRLTGGREGLPVIKIGGCLRVPVAVIERMTQLELPFENTP